MLSCLTSQPKGLANCTSRTDWSYYLSSEDVLQYKNAGRLAADFPLSYEPGNAPQQLIRLGRNPGDAAKTFSLVALGRDKDKLKKGDRVWVVSDGDSLTPVLPAASGSEPVFNDVCAVFICPCQCRRQFRTYRVLSATGRER